MIPKILKRDNNKISIAEFWENQQRDKYNFSPPYQRKSIWSEDQQSFFIDSILKNFPIPPIFLHQKIDSKTGKLLYDVIDGKQRLSAIIKFIQSEIPVSSEKDDSFFDPNLNGKYFKELDTAELATYRENFWAYPIPVEYVSVSDGKIINNIFDRLNRNGEKLKEQELRRAQYFESTLIIEIAKIAKTPFWEHLLKVALDSTRMFDEEFISELLFVILENGMEVEESLVLVDGAKKSIDNFYKKYSEINPLRLNSVVTELEKTANFIADLEAIDSKLVAKLKSGAGKLYGLWSLARYCVINGRGPEMIAAKLEGFITEFEKISNNPYIEQYRNSVHYGTKRKGQRELRLSSLVSYLGI